MEELPGNSHTERQNRRQREEPQRERRVERVTVSDAVVRKPPLGRRLSATLFQGEIWKNIAQDVFLQSAKETLVDAIEAVFESFRVGVNQSLFKDARHRGRVRARSSGYGRDNYTSYSRASSSRYEDRRVPEREQRSVHGFREAILPNRPEAEAIIDAMYDVLSQYEAVRVSDYYDLINEKAEFTDDNFGWTDLKGAGVQRLPGGGYLVELPRPVPLD